MNILSSYSILVLTQGALWSGPTGFPRSDAEVKEHIKNLQTKFAKAQNIVLVGGGAVGFGMSTLSDNFSSLMKRCL
jgi:hypothetical protein